MKVFALLFYSSSLLATSLARNLRAEVPKTVQGLSRNRLLFVTDPFLMASMSTKLAIDSAEVLAECQDASDDVTFQMVNEDEGSSIVQRNCAYMQENLSKHPAWCDWHDNASLCRVTCNTCHATVEAVELLKTCSDSNNLIHVFGVEEQVTCSWLAEHRAANHRACFFTEAALNCPATCNTWELCSPPPLPSSTEQQQPAAASSLH
jgi:hypothetical protein